MEIVHLLLLSYKHCYVLKVASFSSGGCPPIAAKFGVLFKLKIVLNGKKFV
jgi:hypothetical protein